MAARPATSPGRVSAPQVISSRRVAARWSTAVGLSAAVLLGAHQLAVGALGAWSDSPPARARPPARSDLPSRLARPGDSLWSIAEQLEPGADPRKLVHELVRLNGSAMIEIGQVVYLPPGR